MAVQIQNHIHLGTTLDADNAPIGKYSVRFGGLDETPDVPLTIDRAITGALHVHILPDGSGNPKQYTSGRYTLLVQQADLAGLISLFGKIVYYCPITHPDDGESHLSYRKSVVVTIKPGGMAPLTPAGEWWTVAIELQEKP